MKPTVLFAAAFLFASCTALASTERTSFTVTSDPGVEIAIREVLDPSVPRVGDPVILLHGARVPGAPSFDLEVTGGSLAADLAASGLAVYIVDLRGYGASTRPAGREYLASLAHQRRPLSTVVSPIRQGLCDSGLTNAQTDPGSCEHKNLTKAVHSFSVKHARSLSRAAR